jgi:hypothetical protein
LGGAFISYKKGDGSFIHHLLRINFLKKQNENLQYCLLQMILVVLGLAPYAAAHVDVCLLPLNKQILRRTEQTSQCSTLAGVKKQPKKILA